MRISKELTIILSFTLLAFILGTTEYVIVGLLPDVAASLRISVSQAGMLVSGFAVAYALGTPVTMIGASYISKRTALLSGLMLVVLLNVGSAFASSYIVLLMIRLATAIFCGLCISLAISICTELVSTDRQGQAIASIMGGFSIANVLGVPIGTFVGMHYEWPAAFLLIAVFGLACAGVLYRIIPKELPAAASSARDQLRLMANPRVGLAILIPVLGVAAVFVIYTYITPIMTEVMHVPVQWTSWLLLLYGAATVISNVIAGKIATGDYVLKLKRMFLIHAFIFLVYGLTITQSIASIVSLIAIACISFSINAASQLYLIQLTERFVPQARDFASSLMPIGANIGIAIGSAAGALVTDNLGLRYLPWAAVAFALVSYGITALSWRLNHHCSKTAAPDHDRALN